MRKRDSERAAPKTRPELDLLGTWVRVLSVRTRLLQWFDRAKRDLPWRRDRDAYRVLVSELMLQQTRVDVVIPYYERWMALWPDVASLAAAPLDDVLAAWSGLGYYRRARSLHEIARRVVAEHGGRLPDDPERLRELPGIGPYTAAAVASIAYERPASVVDGNVERVVCRLLAIADDPGAERSRVVAEAARRLVTGVVPGEDAAAAPPFARFGDVNQALMELGATVCTPANPSCPTCPVARSCLANRAGLQGDLPKRRERRATVDVLLRAALVRRGDEFLLVRRPEGTLLSGLWELPTTQGDEDLAALARRVSRVLGSDVVLPPRPARSFRHTITHRRLTVDVHEVEVPQVVAETAVEGVAWVRRHDLRDFGVSSMTKKALA
jgi:A/G-specific adenine glycosylase